MTVDPFKSIEDAAGSIVGTQEEELRKAMGDKNYDSYIAYVEASRDAGIESVRAHSLNETLKGFWWVCAGVAALAVSAGLVDWLVR